MALQIHKAADGRALVCDSALNTTARENVMLGPCKLRRVSVYNAAGAMQYLKLSDGTSATPGTTAPDWILPVPASGYLDRDLHGHELSSGLCIWAGDAAGTALGTNPMATGLDVTIETEPV